VRADDQNNGINEQNTYYAQIDQLIFRPL